MNTLTLNQEKLARLAGLGLLLALLSACGAEVTPRSSSLASNGPTVSGTIVGGIGYAECLPFDSQTYRLAGKVTTYYSGGVMQEDKVRIRLTGIADEFDTNAQTFIQIFRTQTYTDKDGNVSMRADPTQVNFSFENSSGQGLRRTTADTVGNRAVFGSFNAADLARLRAANSLAASTTTTGFFSTNTLVAEGVGYEYQGLIIAVYDGTSGANKLLGSVQFLMPVIEANPTVYNSKKAVVLQQLHPFASQIGSNLSEAQWVAKAQSSCF